MSDWEAHTLVGDGNKDVLFLRDMIEESEKAEIERKNKQKNKIAGEIFEEDDNNDEEEGINTWLAQIKAKDEQLIKAKDEKRPAMPPPRNSNNNARKVQAGPSDVEKDKVEKNKDKKEVGEDGISKRQKYYQYDYFKEWDKFDVDNEIKRLEEEDEKQKEYKNFSKKTADPFEDATMDPNDTYKIDSMTPIERRLAAQREKEKGNECMKCGETNAAVQYYSKSLELSPGNHMVLGNRAQAYIGMHCFLQAEMDCDQALAIEPSYLKARYRRAVACREQGKYSEAIKDLEVILREDPEHKTAKGVMDEVKRKLTLKEEREARERKEKEERERYEAAPRRKIAIQEVDDEEDEEDDDGMDKKVMDSARESVRLKKEEEERLLKLEAVRRKKEEGNSAVKKRDFTQAVRNYTAAIKLLPEGDKTEAHLVYSNRAHVYLQQGEYLLAEADCTAALEANVSWAKAHHRRGVARAELGRYDEAMGDLERALKLEADSKQTIDEIRRVRQLQAEQKRNAGAPKRVAIVEVDSDSEDDKSEGSPGGKAPGGGDTDSSDEEVVVINKGASPRASSRMEEEGEMIGDDVPLTAATPSAAGPPKSATTPAGNRVKVEIVESDGEEEEEGVAGSDASAFVASEAYTGSRPGFAFKMGPKGLGYYPDPLSAPKQAPAAEEGAAKRVKVEIQSDSDDEEPATAVSPPSRIKVEIVESDSDDENEPAAPAAAPPPPPAPVLAAWETRDRDAARLARARALKEETDEKFKKGLFEQAIDGYSNAINALGDGEEYGGERMLCYGNRAACRLQIRDYSATIADCNEVLYADESNVKALMRRGLAYEGLERYAKAAGDCREVMSIEYAAGGGLSNMGIKARECLDRCKKHAPEQRSIPIPVRSSGGGSPPAAAAQAEAKAGGKEERARELQEQQRMTAAAAKEMAAKERKSFADLQREATHREAVACKERGNAAFKAGKHHNAIMHYSAAIDLVDDDATFYTNVAAAHYALKDFANALSMSEKAVRLDSSNAKGHYRKAQSLEGLGRLAESRDAYKAGLALLPDSEQLAKGLEMVSARLKSKENAEGEALAKIREMQAAKAATAIPKAAPKAVAEAGAKKDTKAVDNGGREAPASAAAVKKQIKALQRDAQKLAGYLQTIPGDCIGRLLVGGIEEEEIMPVVCALEEHLLSVDAGHTWRLVKSLSSVPRVSITCKMLDKKDLTKLQTLLLKLHPSKADVVGHTVDEYTAVRKALGV